MRRMRCQTHFFRVRSIIVVATLVQFCGQVYCQPDTPYFITTVTATGPDGYVTILPLTSPAGVALDKAGSLFVADAGSKRILSLSSEGTLSTLVSRLEEDPVSVAVDSLGNLYITAFKSNRIMRLSRTGSMTVVAGKSSACSVAGTRGGFGGDGGLATAAQFSCPWGLGIDAQGNLFIADTGNNRIRKVSPDGTISTVVGTGPATDTGGGFSGDGGPATDALLSGPTGVAFDGVGNLYVADSNNSRVRKVSTSGIITTDRGYRRRRVRRRIQW